MVKIKIIRVRAATLVETIIAMLIILVLTGITVTVLVQVTNSGYSIRRLKAATLIDRYISETELQKSFFDEEISEGDFIIRKQVTESDYSKEIVWLKISVYDFNNRLIKYRNSLFLAK